MKGTGEDSKSNLQRFVSGLNKEQADLIMYYLPQLTALLEEPTLPYLQEQFPQTG